MVDPYIPVIILVLGLQLRIMYQLGRMDNRLHALERALKPVEDL